MGGNYETTKKISLFSCLGKLIYIFLYERFNAKTDSFHATLQHKFIQLKIILFLLFSGSTLCVKAQKVEKIYVNLYTDSLKKGTHNYINVDGEFTNGRFLPLDSTKIQFSCPQAKFSGNNLYIPADFAEEKVLVKVILKEDNSKFKEFEVYIKKMEDPPLKTQEEIIAEIKSKRKKNS